MKTPVEQIREFEQEQQLEAKKLADTQLVEQRYCEILLEDFSRQGKVDIKFHYKNKGEVGDCNFRGSICTQEFSVEGVSKILREHGWDVHIRPDDLYTGTVEVHFPDDVEVGISPVEKGVMRPSEYLAVLQNHLSPVLVEMEIGKICDRGLKYKRQLEVELTPYWKVRLYLLVPYVRHFGWLVKVLDDKIVIKYPEEPSED